MTERRQRHPDLTKLAQIYIANFETLARPQFALAMMALAPMNSKHFCFVLPFAFDNAAAEAGINKLVTTTEPLSGIFRVVPAWSARKNVRLT